MHQKCVILVLRRAHQVNFALCENFWQHSGCEAAWNEYESEQRCQNNVFTATNCESSKILPSWGGRRGRCSEMRKICQGNQICFNLWRGKPTALNFHGKQLGIYAATVLANVPLCPVFVFTLADFQPCETPSLKWVIRNTCQAVQWFSSIFKIKDRFLKDGKHKRPKMY